MQWEGSRAQDRALKDTSIKGPKIVEPTKVTEEEQPGMGEGNKESHVLEATGRECLKRQEIGKK